MAASLSLLLWVQLLPASEVHYLRKSEIFCDSSGAVCLDGTLSYVVNPRLLRLRARIAKAPGPGRISISLTGKNRLGHLRRATIEVTIRGRKTEIVRTEMIPDAPDVGAWEMLDFYFAPSG